MIHYQLRCHGGHGFDGWFKDSAGFDSQAGAGLLSCPVCGDANVARALMAPSLGRKQKSVVLDAETAKPVAAPVPAMDVGGGPMPLPDQMRAVLQRIRAEVESKCDYVGPRFAEEARRIHDGDAPARAIYGESTPEQAESLADDGIEVTRVPWIPRADG
jgi:hypothetical protein